MPRQGSVASEILGPDIVLVHIGSLSLRDGTNFHIVNFIQAS
jgi:hypothetical protein